MIFAFEGERTAFGQQHPPAGAGREIDVEMAGRGRAVSEQVAIDPHHRIANAQAGGNVAERQFIDNDRPSALTCKRTSSLGAAYANYSPDAT